MPWRGLCADLRREPRTLRVERGASGSRAVLRRRFSDRHLQRTDTSYQKYSELLPCTLRSAAAAAAAVVCIATRERFSSIIVPQCHSCAVFTRIHS